MEWMIRFQGWQAQVGQSLVKRRSTCTVPAGMELQTVSTLGNLLPILFARALPMPIVHATEACLANGTLVADVRSAHMVAALPRHGRDVSNGSGCPSNRADLWIGARRAGGVYQTALLRGAQRHLG